MARLQLADRSTIVLLRNDHIHRNVVAKRIYRRNGGLAVADADGARLFGQGGKSPIVEPTPISETISLLVETNDRRDHHIRHKFRAIGGDRNVPELPAPAARRCAKAERSAEHFSPRQRGGRKWRPARGSPRPSL